MNDYERLRVMLFQYLMFKGDRLKYNAELSADRLRTSKIINTSDYVQIYKEILKHELFEEIYDELYEIIS